MLHGRLSRTHAGVVAVDLQRPQRGAGACGEWGVATGYLDASGAWHDVPDDHHRRGAERHGRGR